jgi:sugar O-acyltransferase (sialic acid O-acetyltransferase NeuD family)
MKVLGIGGHAKVVIDAALKSGKTISTIYDDDIATHDKTFADIRIKGSISSDLEGNCIIAIGNNKVRNKVDQRLPNCKWQTIIHPSAIIADDVTIGEGTVIMAGAIIHPGTKIGRHAIINTGACIDHDCILGDFCHIAPNCSVAGGVNIKEGAMLGIGSSVIQYLTIGKWTNIGAGSVIINDIPEKCTAFGNPAKPTKFYNV